MLVSFAVTFVALSGVSVLAVLWHGALRQGRLRRGQACAPSVRESESFRSDVIYGVVGNAVFAAALAISMQWTSPDTSVLASVGWAALLVLLHDAYFYWCHRLLHTRMLIGFHDVHHRSTVPTPLSAMAMHPVEAVLEGLFVPIVAVLLHPPGAGFVAFFWAMIALNTIGHLGLRGVPLLNGRPGITWWISESDRHLQHHITPDYNFGAYLACWDVAFKTMAPREDETPAPAE